MECQPHSLVGSWRDRVVSQATQAAEIARRLVADFFGDGDGVSISPGLPEPGEAASAFTLTDSRGLRLLVATGAMALSVLGPASASAQTIALENNAAYSKAMTQIGPKINDLSNMPVVIDPSVNLMGPVAKVIGAMPVVSANKTVCVLVPPVDTATAKKVGLTTDQAGEFAVVRAATFCGMLDKSGKTLADLGRPENATVLNEMLLVSDGTAALRVAQSAGVDIVPKIAAMQMVVVARTIAGLSPGDAHIAAAAHTGPLLLKAHGEVKKALNEDTIFAGPEKRQRIFKGMSVAELQDRATKAYKEHGPSANDFRSVVDRFQAKAGGLVTPAEVAAIRVGNIETAEADTSAPR